MSLSRNPVHRRNRKLSPVLEPIEGRILLSTGVGLYPHEQTRLVAEAARTRRLALNGTLSGLLTAQTTDFVTFHVMIAAQANSGNRSVGPVTLQSSFPTTLAVLASLRTTPVSIPGLGFRLSAPKGSIDSVGTLTVDSSSRQTPFRVTATILGGTGAFAGATGNFTIQGTSFTLISSQGQLQGKLRGTIVTHT